MLFVSGLNLRGVSVWELRDQHAVRMWVSVAMSHTQITTKMGKITNAIIALCKAH